MNFSKNPKVHKIMKLHPKLAAFLAAANAHVLGAQPTMSREQALARLEIERELARQERSGTKSTRDRGVYEPNMCDNVNANARRRHQIANGQITEANGLVREPEYTFGNDTEIIGGRVFT